VATLAALCEGQGIQVDQTRSVELKYSSSCQPPLDTRARTHTNTHTHTRTRTHTRASNTHDPATERDTTCTNKTYTVSQPSKAQVVHDTREYRWNFKYFRLAAFRAQIGSCRTSTEGAYVLPHVLHATRSKSSAISRFPVNSTAVSSPLVAISENVDDVMCWCE
jgi:hypothetical protein